MYSKVCFPSVIRMSKGSYRIKVLIFIIYSFWKKTYNCQFHAYRDLQDLKINVITYFPDFPSFDHFLICEILFIKKIPTPWAK